MSDKKNSSQKKIKELNELIKKYQENTPQAEAESKPTVIEAQPNPNFNVVESNRTLTYTQKEWGQYGKLVRNT